MRRCITRRDTLSLGFRLHWAQTPNIGASTLKAAEAPNPTVLLGSRSMWRTWPKPLTQSVVPRSDPAGNTTISLRAEPTDGAESLSMNTPDFPMSRVVPMPSYHCPSADCHWNQALPVMVYLVRIRLSVELDVAVGV